VQRSSEELLRVKLSPFRPNSMYCMLEASSGIPFVMSNSNSTFLFSFVTNDFVQLKTSGDTPPPMYGQASAFDDEKCDTDSDSENKNKTGYKKRIIKISAHPKPFYL